MKVRPSLGNYSHMSYRIPADTESAGGLHPPSKAIAVDHGQSLQYLEESFDPTFGFQSNIAPEGDFAKRMTSPPEIFSCLLVSQFLSDTGIEVGFLKHIPRLIQKVTNTKGFLHFFFDKKLLVADLDCTAVGYSLLIRMKETPNTLHGVIDGMVQNVDDAGVMEVYLKPAGEHAGRIDECVLVNALHLLYSVGRESEAKLSEQAVFDFLENNAFLHGTRYYPSPDAFLYFLSRLVRDFPKTRPRFLNGLMEAFYERREHTSTFVDLALRTAALDNLNIRNMAYHRKVLSSQTPGGYWQASPFFKYGRKNLYFGGAPLSTGLGIRATTHRAPALKRDEPECEWDT